MAKEKLLFVDGCISTHESRTKRLCDAYIERFLEKHPEVSLETFMVREGNVMPFTEERLKERDRFVVKKDFDGEMFDIARQFKEADYIVIGAPYWDLSFPSLVKVYVENVVVADLTFKATSRGFEGLCKGKELVYITTAGGFIGEKNFGYQYFQGLAGMLGLENTRFYGAEALDIEGFDAEAIVEEKIEEIKKSV
ncbi:MAG: NAD(P)H-dependent oxidoreductase [Eubacteriales bacterium]|nr:NAD(P)H-dependent oxidoreductase [Eubacteriales bacterium]